ncbi:hypothetical protein V6N13_031655 [Hibiscus sabdariffa]|uniref:Uncharacterized protein n=1 Tax=Hibiscus sabdariffa TaxID=183260 RepID=A0ABR2CJN9_9ROSI
MLPGMKVKINMAACKVVILFFSVNLLLQVSKHKGNSSSYYRFSEILWWLHTDTGNYNQLSTTSSPKPLGSNQPYPEARHDFATGISFASPGTGYDNATSNVMSIIPFWMELDYHKEYQDKLRGHLGKDEANHQSSEYSVDKYKFFLKGIASNFIRELYRPGTQKLLIINLPPMVGMFTIGKKRTVNMLFGNECIDEYNNMAKDFNKRLQGAVPELKQEFHGIHLVMSNPYDKLMR